MRSHTIVLFVSLGLLTLSCTEVTQLNTSPSGLGGGAGSAPITDSQGVTAVQLFPAAVKIAVFDEARLTVVTRVGALEVIAPFQASTEDASIAVVLAPTGSSTIERQVIVEGKKVGTTRITVRSGGVTSSAEVQVVVGE